MSPYLMPDPVRVSGEGDYKAEQRGFKETEKGMPPPKANRSFDTLDRIYEVVTGIRESNVGIAKDVSRLDEKFEEMSKHLARLEGEKASDREMKAEFTEVRAFISRELNRLETGKADVSSTNFELKQIGHSVDRLTDELKGTLSEMTERVDDIAAFEEKLSERLATFEATVTVHTQQIAQAKEQQDRLVESLATTTTWQNRIIGGGNVAKGIWLFLVGILGIIIGKYLK